MLLLFSISSDGQKLVLKYLNLCHNHDSFIFSTKFLPKSTKLNQDEVSYIQQLVEVDGNSRAIQEKLLRENGKVVSIKSYQTLGIQ